MRSKYQYEKPPFQEWSMKADFAELSAHNRELAAKPATFLKASKGEKATSKMRSSKAEGRPTADH